MAEKTSAPMTLSVLTPQGEDSKTLCDSVQLTLSDDAQGRGGGLIGIRRGHRRAVMALGSGVVRASLGGETVFLARTQGGFASVRDNVVAVIADSVEKEM